MTPEARKARRALVKRVAVTVGFTPEDQTAIGYEIGTDEPSAQHLRRFMQRAIETRLEAARQRYAERVIEPEADIGF